ncbi:Manganese/iron superoxide dismutase [Lasiosphaeris hirsuta]|uniref:Manganese/iron superoxide dismutase n=1 Tax=Lasiosphaeris hirsuta TaxID=260670 RepID=A0AA40BC31_9PEZI|nr:Manganese/iron superoxide dismutase [Lasiosphaeris hirsuta]
MFRPRLRLPRAPQIGLTAPSSSSSSSPFLRPLPLTCSRGAHNMPKLREEFSKDGVPGLLSKNAFSISWHEYQQSILNGLNQVIDGTEWENKDIKHIILNSARQPESAVLFNYASMAHNNHFFFEQLAYKPVEMPADLELVLTQSFGSIETLRNQMILTARSMFGPGFVWLVKVTNQVGRTHTFKVLATYHAGSPYSGAHWRRQEVEIPSAIKNGDDGIDEGRKYLANSAYGSGGRKTPGEVKKPYAPAPGGTDVTPLLCLNTWEHVWIMDYGVDSTEGGLKQYAQEWWKVIDWEKVRNHARLHTKPMQA